MCIVVACVVAFGSVVSCFNKPLKASASGPDLDIVQDFWRVYNNNLNRIQEAITHDISNGNLDATSSLGKQYLNILAYQVLFKNYDPDSAMFENDWEHETFSLDMSGSVAFYRVQGDDTLYTVNVYPVKNASYPYTAVVSNHFNISISLSNYLASGSFPTRISYTDIINGDPYTGFRFTGSGSNRNIYFSDKSGFFLDHYTQTYGFGAGLSTSSIPILTPGASPSISGFIYGGFPSSVDLPEGTINTDQPWNYYNDVLLPYLKITYPNVDIDYFVFPNGYNPSINSDPTEPGTMPSGGISIGSNNNIDIDINVYYPTDESGQPITDESGETVTETYYVTDTTPTDVVYKFTIPTLPNLDRYSDTLPPMNLAQFESGINFIFSVADGIFTDTGFLPVIIVTLSLCALCYVIWKIGG